MIKLKIGLPSTDKLGWPLLTWENKVNGRIEEGKRAHWDFHRLYVVASGPDSGISPRFHLSFPSAQLGCIHKASALWVVGPTRSSLMCGFRDFPCRGEADERDERSSCLPMIEKRCHQQEWHTQGNTLRQTVLTWKLSWTILKMYHLCPH